MRLLLVYFRVLQMSNPAPLACNSRVQKNRGIACWLFKKIFSKILMVKYLHMKWLLSICVSMEVLFMCIASETPLEFMSKLRWTQSSCFANPALPTYPRSSAQSILFRGVSSVKVRDIKRSVICHATRNPVTEISGAASTPAALVQAAGSPAEILQAVAELPLPGEEVLHFQLQLHHQRKRLV